MPLLPEGVELYKSLSGQPAISKRTVEDLRSNLLSQKEPDWGTVSPDSLKVQLLADPSFAGGQPVSACCLQACVGECMFWGHVEDSTAHAAPCSVHAQCNEHMEHVFALHMAEEKCWTCQVF